MKDEKLKLEEIEVTHTLDGFFVFIIRGKTRTKENVYRWVSV